LMNLVDYYYGRDLNVRFELTHFLVRTAPFYTPTSGGDLLNQFRAEWNGPQAGIPRDLAHLMTAKPGSIIEFGGLAWVGALCGSIQYGWSTNSANALGHEIGHNFGAPHCLDTEECNNMCGGCLSIAGNTRRRKFEHMGTVNCLSDGGAYPTPVPPFVENERLDVHAGQLADMLNAPLEIDVLANDDDGNCDPIGIGSFDPFSLRGGQIQSTPVAGGLRLTYTPPAIPFRGSDEFAYTVVDSTGLSTEGRVVIEVRPEEMRAHWPMEEGAGLVLGDATWRAQEGALEGGVNWTSGPSGSALLFDGNDDVVRLPALNLDLPHDQLTITGWLRRDGIQAPWSGVAFSRSSETVSGLMFGPSGIQLRYTWNDDPGTYNWSTGAPTPDGVWCFFGLTVRGDQATVHLHDGTSWVRGTNVRPHEGQRFEAEWFLGQDSGSSARRFAGALDELRVHDYALSNAEIEALRLAHAPAAAPEVRDGGVFWPLPDALSWVPGGAGVQRRLYLSPNYFTVAQATPGSPSDLGLFSQPEFAMPVLFPGLRHYWRVDEVSLAGLELPGPVWQFDPGQWNHWRLDEASNAQPVLEEEEGANGSFSSGPLLGVPGATAMTGTAMRLSGSPQHASLPPLLLNSDRMTITCWFKRAAGQSGRQGLVFSRASGTTAGLDINGSDQLGYHWHSGSHWGWDSGLVVPTDTWVFAALVIEPD
ncbi:MAG: LamG-like jellyroll fold domain-containing protein, partial [Planctomycetota bacterium]